MECEKKNATLHIIGRILKTIYLEYYSRCILIHNKNCT